MYGNFAGRDASRGMAKQSFDIGEVAKTRAWPMAYHTYLQKCSLLSTDRWTSWMTLHQTKCTFYQHVSGNHTKQNVTNSENMRGMRMCASEPSTLLTTFVQVGLTISQTNILSVENWSTTTLYNSFIVYVSWDLQIQCNNISTCPHLLLQ